MNESKIEAMLASPPERDELVVQLFVKDGGQWAEIYREQDAYWIDIYLSNSEPMRFGMDALIQALTHSQAELRERLDDHRDS